MLAFNKQMRILVFFAHLSHGQPFATCGLRFDCFSRVLALPTLPGLSKLNKHCKFEVMVSLSELSMGSGSVDAGDIKHSSTVRPCARFMSTSAPNIYFAFCSAAQVLPIWVNVKHILVNVCAVAMHIACNNASSNWNCIAHLFAELGRKHKTLLLLHKHCSLHSNDIIKGVLVR